MKTKTNQLVRITTALALALLTAVPGTLLAGNPPESVPKKTAVTGGFGWDIIAASGTPTLIPSKVNSRPHRGRRAKPQPPGAGGRG